MQKIDIYKLERLWRRWENMAQNLELRAKTERWEDTKKELHAVARTYRRAAEQLRKQAEEDAKNDNKPQKNPNFDDFRRDL